MRSCYRNPTVNLSWCGYVAFALGMLHAATSIYWGLGGTAGLHTVGGELEQRARERDPVMLVTVWIAAALKVFAAVLGLAVVRPWGLRLPRRPLLVTAWSAAALLTLYGAFKVVGQALVKVDLIRASPDMDWTAFHWHLYLWDPWFLLWGLSLCAATFHGARQRPGPAPHEGPRPPMAPSRGSEGSAEPDRSRTTGANPRAVRSEGFGRAALPDHRSRRAGAGAAPTPNCTAPPAPGRRGGQAEP